MKRIYFWQNCCANIMYEMKKYYDFDTFSFFYAIFEGFLFDSQFQNSFRWNFEFSTVVKLKKTYSTIGEQFSQHMA